MVDDCEQVIVLDSKIQQNTICYLVIWRIPIALFNFVLPPLVTLVIYLSPLQKRTAPHEPWSIFTMQRPFLSGVTRAEGIRISDECNIHGLKNPDRPAPMINKHERSMNH